MKELRKPYGEPGSTSASASSAPGHELSVGGQGVANGRDKEHGNESVSKQRHKEIQVLALALFGIDSQIVLSSTQSELLNNNTRASFDFHLVT